MSRNSEDATAPEEVGVINVALPEDVRRTLRLISVLDSKTYAELITAWVNDEAGKRKLPAGRETT